MGIENFNDNRRFTDHPKNVRIDRTEIFRSEGHIGKFRCDNCKWNYINACHDRRRPNVTWEMDCNEFEPKIIHQNVRIHYKRKKSPWWKRLCRWFGF